MNRFTIITGSDVRDDSLNLEIYKGQYSAVVVKIRGNDSFKIFLDENDPDYSLDELTEILQSTIPFSIRTAENNAIDRQEAIERGQDPNLFQLENDFEMQDEASSMKSIFTSIVTKGLQGSSKHLQIIRKELTEIELEISETNKFQLVFDQANAKYSARELLEILRIIVSFCLAK